MVATLIVRDHIAIAGSVWTAYLALSSSIECHNACKDVYKVTVVLMLELVEKMSYHST